MREIGARLFNYVMFICQRADTMRSKKSETGINQSKFILPALVFKIKTSDTNQKQMTTNILNRFC